LTRKKTRKEQKLNPRYNFVSSVLCCYKLIDIYRSQKQGKVIDM